jgi:hypothetical protein
MTTPGTSEPSYMIRNIHGTTQSPTSARGRSAQFSEGSLNLVTAASGAVCVPERHWHDQHGASHLA